MECLLQIIVNGEETGTEACNLAGLCEDLGLVDASIATALNGDFVPASSRADTLLQEGDMVEIVAPRQGG
jgi:sulfur carrier protein